MNEPTTPPPIALPCFGPVGPFFDVEGKAVSVSKGDVRLWRNGNPEPFSLDSALRGRPISETRFRELVLANSKPVDLTKIPLEQFANLAAGAIAANLRAQASEPSEDEERKKS